MAISFLGDLLQSISDRGRGLMGLSRADALARVGLEDLLKLCDELISRRGEASGVALARMILDRYASLLKEERFAFLTKTAERFGSDDLAIERAIAAYREMPTRKSLGALHAAAEPRSQELIRRLNLADRGTLSLVRMREDLLDLIQGLKAQGEAVAAEQVISLDHDFEHLFSSWFNRGFLCLKRIDWTTPAHILEKIIRYEAVHEISDWDDLRRRIEPADRRCFAFFHPALVDEPLVFVEVALTTATPAAIAPILATRRDLVAPQEATTAVFYSISNCQRGLTGVSFGNFLIKQVVQELCSELASLKTFVTLSPAPGFAGWLGRECRSETPSGITTEDRELLRAVEDENWFRDPAKSGNVRRALVSAAAYYFLRAKTSKGRPLDPVARFHLGNGARLERINYLGDLSPKGVKQSYGVMVNYLYDLQSIEKNHEAYANLGTVIASNAVNRELKQDLPARALAVAE